ncbi:hypothetical protein [Fulvivirga ligni]|uniref:hypothetical protein n=1 Tax=Fulvivirga ligni TaxID=2904246 RepID=UPI001F267069|nr:hypothetical protein [Fulvivirga ligni]UII20002.1 hypothetical protein LVD16_19340 [Fulvivirga ligni]
MKILIGLIGLALFVTLIVGLIKPAYVLKWDKKPNRLKVFGYWILSIVALSVLSAMTESEEDRERSHLSKAKNYMKEESYEEAIKELEDIDTSSEFYQKAQLLIKEADSLSLVTDEQKQLAREIEAREAAENKLVEQKAQLEREIASINEGVDFSPYRGSVDALQLELALFAMWANIISNGEDSPDAEIKKLSKVLKSKIVKLQVDEFPKLRKNYAQVVGNLMWELDIYVNSSSSRDRYLNITGAIFAANKNIKEAQQKLLDAPKLFRFRETRYRWYKGQEDFTYYTTYQGKDSDLVDISE